MTSPLFTPFTLNRIALRNRFVIPAMQHGMYEGGAPRGSLPSRTLTACMWVERALLGNTLGERHMPRASSGRIS